MKQYYVYIMASESKTIYSGVTNNLERRLYEHKNGLCEGFSKKYNCTKLVFFELFSNIEDAIASEKRIKNWRRDWKVNLIEKENPYWEDLSLEFNDPEINSGGQNHKFRMTKIHKTASSLTFLGKIRNYTGKILSNHYFSRGIQMLHSRGIIFNM